MSGIINALFGGQPQNLEYVGYTECPICGDDCAEIWRDITDGKEYTRCPFIGCDGWRKLVELSGERMSEYITEFFGSSSGGSYTERREEIVRCRDCRHAHHDPAWQPDRRFKPVDLWSCHAEWCEGFEGDHPVVEPDGFCKWGVRK